MASLFHTTNNGDERKIFSGELTESEICAKMIEEAVRLKDSTPNNPRILQSGVKQVGVFIGVYQIHNLRYSCD